MTNFISELLKSPRPFLVDVVRVHRRQYFISLEVMNKQTKNEIGKLSRGTNSILYTTLFRRPPPVLYIHTHTHPKAKLYKKITIDHLETYILLHTPHKYTYTYIISYIYTLTHSYIHFWQLYTNFQIVIFIYFSTLNSAGIT